MGPNVCYSVRNSPTLFLGWENQVNKYFGNVYAVNRAKNSPCLGCGCSHWESFPTK